MIRFFIRLLNYTLLVCFLGSLWGGWYLSKQGFGKKWRKKLSEEFAKRGVELTARRLTLDPLRGLVAREVRVYRDTDHEETVALIDELRLDINYTRLLRKEPFLDALILSEAEVLLDADPSREKSGEFTIHHLAAQLNFQPDRVELRRLQGEGLGVYFSISGVLEHRPDWQTASDSSNISQHIRTIPQAWFKELAQVRFGPKLGRFDLRFSGNLAQKRWLQSADGRLEIPELRWRGLHFNQLSAEADLTERLVTIRRLNWSDDHGPMSLSGTWQPGSRGKFTVDSQVDAPAFFQEMKWFPGLASAAKMQFLGDVAWTENSRWNWQIVGKLDAADLIYRSVKWDRIQTQLSLTPTRWFAQDVQLQQKNDLLSGQYLNDNGQTTAELTSTIDPRCLWLSTGQDLPAWLDELDFAVHPWVQLKIVSSPDAPDTLQTDGDIVFGRTNFRGVALTSAQAHFNQRGDHLALSQIQITRPEGQCTGEAFWNAKTSELAFWDITNSIDLVAWGLWTDRATADALETVRLPKNTTLHGDGKLVWKQERLASFQMQITADALPVFELPIFASLGQNESEHRAPFRFQCVLIVQNGQLQVAPFTASSESNFLSGQLRWNLVDQTFSGLLEQKGETTENKRWIAESPWNKILWNAHQ